MKQDYIDHIVKKALEQLKPPMPTGAWQQMQQHIHKDATLQNSYDDFAFDKAVKIALTEKDLPHAPMQWAAMEARIDQTPDLQAADIDTPIKEALEHIEAPYRAGTWDLMEAQLDLEDNILEYNESGSIDHLVYEKLNDYQVPYDVQSWWLFRHKLENVLANRRQTILQYKVIEFSLIFLLCLLVLPFLWSPTVSEPSRIAQNHATKEQPTMSANTEQPVKNHQTTAALKADQRTIPTPSSLPSVTEEIVVFSDEDDMPFNNTKGAYRAYKNQTQAQATEEITLAILEEHNMPPTRVLLAPYNTASEAFPITDALKLRLLPSKKITPLLVSEGQKIQNCLTCALPRAIGVHISMFLMGEYNYIYTPFDRIFELESYHNGSYGYGLGSTIAFSYGKWEVETGTMFSSKAYRPLELNETVGDFESGYIERSLHRIELNVMQVPLNIRYNFDRLPNWNIYTTAGASMHVATHVNYDINAARTADPSAEKSLSRNSLRSIIDQNSSFNFKNVSGWLEGGSFLENRYFTANLGFGLERSIGSRWSIFTQSMYHHALLSEGFGPNDNRLHTFSVFTGVRANIGMKYQKRE